MSEVLKIVPPRSKDSIRRDAYLLRKKLDMLNIEYFPIVHFLENVLPISDPTFYMEVLEDEQLMGIQAEYIPQSNTIRVKSSVYEAAINGHWLARSTLAHEVGHYYYHDEKNVRYARLSPGQKVPPDYDPERQANIFAAELLAPVHLIKGMTEKTIGQKFGVPYSTAKQQLFGLKKIEKRKEKKRQNKKKRSSRDSTADRT